MIRRWMPEAEFRRVVRRKTIAHSSGGGRDYLDEPADPDEAWLFHQWMSDLFARGKATAFRTGPHGKPLGYRESKPGAWLGELTQVNEIAQAEPRWTLDQLAPLTQAEFTAMVGRWSSWWPRLIDGLAADPDVPFGAKTRSEIDAIVSRGRQDPVWFRAVLYGLPTPPEPAPIPPEAMPALFLATAQLLEETRRQAEDQAGDYDPVRDGPRPPAAQLELQAEQARNAVLRYLTPAAQPPPTTKGKAPRLRHEHPIRSQTRREVRERFPKGHPKAGRFTGKTTPVVVPTMIIDNESYLGKSIRVIDDDSGRKDPPRGALGYIETSGGKRRHWIVPVDSAGHYRGASREDRHHRALRQATGSQTLALRDNDGKPREFVPLVTPRSRHFETALEFAGEFARLQRQEAKG